jgi:nitrite reductase/ring-hydroxylating ferredoxin subunit
MQDNAVVSHPGQSRRKFIKTYVQFAAYFGLCAPVCRYFIGEVQAQSSGLAGVFNVNLSVSPFTALQNLNGSVRVEVPNGAGINSLVAVNNTTPSIIITRVATSGNNQFGSLGQRCTHEGNAVSAKVSGQNYLLCPTHLSRFDITTGAVLLGPAASALTAYTTAFVSAPAPGTLQISISGIGYTFVGNTVTATQGQRVRLIFPSRLGSNYQVLLRNAATGAESVVSFFTTQNGTSAVNTVAGTGSNISVYLTPPPQVGFYRIVANP